MTEASSARSTRRNHWRRDLVELAALFTAVAVADGVANTVAHGPSGPVLLCSSAVALLATAVFHVWWSRRHENAPPPTDTGATAPSPAGPAPRAAGQETTLWRMRTTVRDEPGSLAALCTALAGQRVDILSLQTHPLSDGTVDEFLLRAPGSLRSDELTRTVAGAGGAHSWLERADAHDLVDAPTRMLGMATRTALDSAELPLALRQLLGRCTIHSVPARSLHGRPLAEQVPTEGVLEEHRMKFRDSSGGSLTIERPQLPFTPTEFARVRALVDLDARLGQRVPPRRDVLTLPEGNEITIRRADTSDLAAAREMHDRCSPRTLALRYHGPIGDADRYLGHLLSPRFGRTLAVETASGRLVALGHLLWDGDETEVALLVEDAWQQRGIGAELLRRLAGMAAETGCESVYAITQASNTGMVAAMRGLGLPLDYQIEEGTLVITARPAGLPTRREPRESVRIQDATGRR
ncbi:GNAT family N-acetyltransferase [Streptomyces sioyaensis]|uniref:GNAT family N-acetyltransferase n=1 Tax=Streptomyces sioyaensis TaxID=67364 RepID=A0A4Q1QTB7_9ACTN|nr:GNAT family N-acetyltransferase [Streptomyces sioyaensis]MBM4796633.1 GNAT family N-acetyltransferase [Streptomyces sioyaensis]RXS60010.1 GNAT family N-acetyltransferase [Streptomyces sioyaensis]